MSRREAFILIDAQVNMFDPLNPAYLANELLERLTQLLAFFRTSEAAIVFVRNCGGAGDPDERGTPGWRVHPSLQPRDAELVLDKTTCDTFASTTLGEDLKALGISDVVIAGLQSEYCIRETVLGALAREFDVRLVSDGHSTYDSGGRGAPEISSAVNAELDGRVALVSTEDVRSS